MTKGFIIQMILLLILGLSLNQISILVGWLFPETIEIKVKTVYLDKNYKPPKVTVLYFIYELAPYVDNVLRAFVFFKISAIISFRLTKVAFWFMVYYLSQVFFYLWNRNTSGITNLIALFTICIIILQIILPDKEISKIRSID